MPGAKGWIEVNEKYSIEYGEERWQTIGVVEGVVMLLVAHTVREQDDVEVIRIISARRANHKERRRYEEENSCIRDRLG